MPRVFLVEDDFSLSQVMYEWLGKYGYEVEKVTDFKNVEQQFRKSDADIVILEINLPYFDGFYFVKYIRRSSRVPIIIVSARNGSADQIMGMELGADDYVVKPFDIQVLIAKMNALLRRIGSADSTCSTIIKAGGLELDTEKLTVTCGQIQSILSKNEFILLKKLIDKPGTVIKREELFEALWDDITFVEENTLSVNIARLKSRLEEIGFPGTVRVRRGLGYYLDMNKAGEI
jgi:DNA-binding response OmpR family regulator